MIEKDKCIVLFIEINIKIVNSNSTIISKTDIASFAKHILEEYLMLFSLIQKLYVILHIYSYSTA